MKINKQARRDAKELFQSSLSGGLLDEALVRQIVQRVLASKPRGYLAILTHFLRLAKIHLDRRTARIESPVGLSEQEKKGLTASLNTRYGGNLIFDFQQNTALIGGLRIRVGSDVLDGSVRARLDALEETL